MPLVVEERTFPGRTNIQRGVTGRKANTPRDIAFRESTPSLPIVALVAVVFSAAIGGAVVATIGLNALYLCAAVVACGFILADFRIGVILLILLMPLSRSQLFPHEMLGVKGLNPVNLLLLATLGSWFVRALGDGGLRRFLPVPLLVLYIVPIVVAGVLGAPHVPEIPPAFFANGVIDFHDATGYVSELVVKPLMIVAFALLVGAAAARSAAPEKFLVPLLISVWIMALIEIVFVALSGVGMNQLADAESREFLSSLGLHANELGHLYAITLALLIFTWSAATSRALRFALVATIAVVLVALVLTFSRSAYTGVAVVAVLYVWWHRNIKTIVLAGMVFAAGLFLLPEAVFDRMSMGFGEGLNTISAGRIEGLWLPLFPEVLKSPIYGSGLASILWSEPMRIGAGNSVLAVTHPHSAYLELALDMGFVGLILVCAYFATVWSGLRKIARDPSVSPTLRGFFLGAAAGLAGLLVADLVDSSLAPRAEQVFLWVAIGMMYGQRAR